MKNYNEHISTANKNIRMYKINYTALIRKSLIAVLFGLLFIGEASASHLVGGDLSYRHIIGEEYEINLRIYFDAISANSNVSFDDPAIIYIYDTNGNQIERLEIPLNTEDITELSSTSDECAENPQVLDFEVYTYTSRINLPKNGIGYDIFYQRCCRNSVVQNIEEPDNTGMTLHVEVTAEALNLSNTSPHFNQFNNVIFCVGDTSVVDFGVFDTDSNADSITYETFTPYAAGSNVDPYISDINQPPPFDTVVWETTYDVDHQLGQTSYFNLDVQNGQLTLVPSSLGRFLVGVRALEWKDGAIITKVTKEFEFTTVLCQTTEALFSESPSYCGETLIEFENESLLADSFAFYPDLIEFPDSLIITADTNEVIQFDYLNTGTYNPTLVAYGPICNDTLTKSIIIYPEDYLQTLFDSLFVDSILICSPDSINLNLNLDNLAPFDKFTWSIDNVNFSNLPNPSLFVDEDLNITVTAEVNGSGCAAATGNLIINLLQLADGSELDKVICLGESIELNPTFENTTIVSVDWLPDYNISALDGESVMVSPEIDTVYEAYISYEYDINCPLDTIIRTYSVKVIDLDVDIIPSSEINCDEQGVKLTADPMDNTLTYKWYDESGFIDDGSMLSDVNPIISTTYTLIATNTINGCSDTTTQEIIVPDSTLFMNIIGDPVTFCFGETDSIEVTAVTNITVGTIEWTDGSGNNLGSGETVSILPQDNLEIIASIIEPNGCEFSDTTFLSENDDFQITGSDVINCIQDGEAVLLTVSPDDLVSYQWFDGEGNELIGETGASILVDPTLTTIYTVVATDNLACTATTTIKVIVPPIIDITFEYDPINCPGLDIETVITAGPADLLDFQWFDNDQFDPPAMETDNVLSVDPDNSTWYYVMGTDQDGCEHFDSVFVEVPPIPDISIQGDSINCLPDENCATLFVTYDPNINFSFQWSGGLEPINPSSNDTICVDPSVTTTYTCVVTDLQNGCPDTLEFTVFVPDSISVDITGIDLLCINDLQDITLTAVVSPDVPVSYEWTDLTNDTILSGTSNSIVVSPSSDNSYQVLATDNFGCSDLDNFQVSITDPIDITFEYDPINCPGLDIETVITAGPADLLDFQWFDNDQFDPPAMETDNVLSVDPDNSTWYYVMGTDQNGCEHFDSVFVEVPPIPDISIQGDSINCLPDENCATLFVTYDPNINFSFQWSGGLEPINPSSNDTICVDPSVTTTYTCVVTDLQNGCPDTLEFTVFVPDSISVDITGIDLLCINDLQDITLTAVVSPDVPVSYEWTDLTNDTILSGTSNSIVVSPSSDNSYQVLATDNFGCSDLDNFQVSITDPIDITFEYNPINCPGLDIETVITAGPADLLDFQWFDNDQFDPPAMETDNVLSVDPDNSTWYYVMGTDQNGCEHFDSVFVEVPPIPDISIQGDSINCLPDENCATLFVTYDPNINFSFQWSGGLEPINPSSNDTICVDPSVTTTYTCVVTDLQNGCPDTLEFTVFVPDSISVDITGIDLLCINDLQDITLTAVVSPDVPVSYEWTDLTNDTILSGTSNSIVVSPSSDNSYQVLATDNFGCSDSDVFHVSITDPIDITFEYDPINCPGLDTETVITAGPADLLNFQWFDNDQFNPPAIETNPDNVLSVDPDSSTWYYVIGIDQNGCEYFDSVFVEVPPIPDISIQGDSINCLTDKDSATLFVTYDPNINFSFQWSGGLEPINPSTNDTIYVAPSVTTTYTCVVTDLENGCPNTLEFTVFVPDSISVDIIGIDLLCNNNLQDITLTAVVSPDVPVSYEWTDLTNDTILSGTSNSIVVSPSIDNSYQVLATDNFGCSDSDVFHVSITDPIDITFEYDPINCPGLDTETVITAGPADLLNFQWFDNDQFNPPAIETNPDNVLSVDPDSSTWYYVIGIDQNGCEYFDSVFVEVPPIPDISIQGDSINCLTDKDSATLFVTYDPNINFSFQWSGGLEPINPSTNDTIYVAPSVTTTYTCVVTDLENGCPNTLEFTVFVPDSISVDIIGIDLLCNNNLQDITLTAVVSPDVPVSYEWTDLTNDTILSGTSNSIVVSPSIDNSYQVLATDNFGCFDLDNFQVSVTDTFSITVSASDSINCLSDDVGIELTGLTDLLNPMEVYWTNNVNNEIINGDTATVNPDTITTYIFTVIDAFGCKEVDSVRIVVPSITITVDGTDNGINCLTDLDSILLTVSSNVDSTLFTWCEVLGDTINTIYTGYDTTILVNPLVTTTYIVNGVDSYGCESADTSIVFVPDNILEIELENELINCITDTLPVNLEVIYLSDPSATVTWYQDNLTEPIGTGLSLDVNPQETTLDYYAIAEDEFGCIDTAWVDILVPDIPNIFIPSDIFCTDTTEVCIQPQIPYSSIIWEVNNIVLDEYEDMYCATINLNSHINTYTVSFTDTFGCTVKDTAVLTNGALDIDIIQDTILCPGDAATFSIVNYDSPTDILTVEWLFDDTIITEILDNNTDLTIRIDMPDYTGTITAVVSNQFNCSDTLSVTVETTDFDPIPLEDYSICYLEEICLNPNANPEYLYTWSSPDYFFDDPSIPNPCIELSQSSTFSLLVETPLTAQLYCSDSMYLNVDVNDKVEFELWSNLSNSPVDGQSDTFCMEQNIDLWVQDSVNLESITWYLNGNLISEDIFSINSPEESGSLTFTVFASNNTVLSCIDSSEVNYEIHPIVASLSDTCICYVPGEEYLLSINDADGISYIDWLEEGIPDDLAVFVSPEYDTTYQVAVANYYGCSDTLTADICVINLFDGLVLTANPDTIARYSDVEIMLDLDLINTDSVDYINWIADPEQSVLLINNDVYQNVAQYLDETTIFTVVIGNYINELACESSIDVSVEVLEPDCDESNIFVPSAFSPNGDDLNDKLFVRGNVIDSMELYIVNRWGQTIFESNDINIGWDGTFLGEELPPDVYGFSLKAYCKDDEIYELKGNINLIK